MIGRESPAFRRWTDGIVESGNQQKRKCRIDVVGSTGGGECFVALRVTFAGLAEHEASNEGGGDRILSTRGR